MNEQSRSDESSELTVEQVPLSKGTCVFVIEMVKVLRKRECLVGRRIKTASKHTFL